MSEKFRIKGVGIDTTGMSFSPSTDKLYEYYDYIHTSISENNDYLVSDFVKSQSGAPLITTVETDKDISKVLLGHLLTLGRKKVDLLLVPADADWENPELFDLITNGIVGELGISCPESLARVKEVSEIYQKHEMKLKHVGLSLCPLHFRYDVVKWCIENNMVITSFNPFGGKLSAPSIISSFTVPYLLGFSATYSDIVFLSGSDLAYSNAEYRYLKDLIGADTEPKYVLRKSVSKLIKPLKKVVSTSLSMGPDLVLPFDSPGMIYNNSELILSLTGNHEILPEKPEPGTNGTYDLLDKYITVRTDYPELPQKTRYAVFRYDVLGYISIQFPTDSGWEIESKRLGDLITVVVARRELKKGWTRKKEVESKTFIIGMSGPERNDYFYTVI